MSARFVTFALLLALLGTVQRAWSADMHAWLDRNRISEGETVQLTLEVQGQVNQRPDTTPVDKDFDVLGISSGSRVSIVNGRTDTRSTWTLTLSPKRSGTLTIPALRIGVHQSAPLTLRVSEAATAAPGGGDILIETDIEPRAPYVQGEVLYTARLLHAVTITNGRLGEPKPQSTLVQRLGEDRKYATTRDGRRYQVIERRYALFPQSSGALELAAPVFDGKIPDTSRRRADPLGRFFRNDPFFGRDPFDGLMTPSRRVRVRGEPARLEVQPRPTAAQGLHWLPAKQLTLKGKWQPDEAVIHSGEPLTLVLELDAQGLTGGQLPSLAPEAVAGFKVYPDQAQRNTDVGETGVTGHLRQQIAFIPEQAGELALPDIEVRWWDTQADKERVATLRGRRLKVSQAPGEPTQEPADAASSLPTRDVVANEPVPAASPPDPAPVAPQRPTTSLSGPWHWISAGLASGWLLTLVVWWWRTRQSRSAAKKELQSGSNSPGLAAARKEFLVACQAGDALTARRTLLAWSATRWPADPPRGLDALAERLKNDQARELLNELDRALYKEGGAWDGTRLAETMRRLPQPRVKDNKAETTLAPLYPDSTPQPYG